MSADFSGQVVVVTGASGGIGRVIARRYARRGAHVALAARRSDALAITAEIIAEEHGSASVHVTDIRAEESCRGLVADVIARWGRLDVLINNAATPGIDEAVHEASVANWNDVLATNLIAPMVLSREALSQAMLPAGRGNVQFMSSAAATNVQPKKAHYAVAKLGLSALSQTMAMELGHAGIRVNCLIIGSVAGQLFDTYVGRRAAAEGVDPSMVRRRLAGMNKLNRLVQPDEVAEVSMWLASDGASAITGQDIRVTGG